MSNPPVAKIQPDDSTAHRLFGGSRLWLLTLLCLIISAGLIWWSLPQQGTTIHINFPEGHGLQPDDTVRFRGIEVGTVESVQLGGELDGVEVEVLLKPFARRLATEGTRYWIVRPELSLTRISGLETAIGHKYIGVSPSLGNGAGAGTVAGAETAAETGAETTAKFQPRATRFRGLADVPVDTLSDDGIELILRGDKRFSVGKGSTVTFRGVDVGTVLDVVLSQDGRHVDFRVRIFDQHTKLLTSQTKFWASSGLDIDFKFGFNGGFNLDTESLETLARGGVSMITTGQGKSVSPGDVFTLHAAADEDWYSQANSYRTTDVTLKGAVPLKATWIVNSIFGNKEKSTQFNGVATRIDGAASVLFPADAIADARSLESFQLFIAGQPVSLDQVEPSIHSDRLLSFPIVGRESDFDVLAEFADATEPLNCLAVRKSAALSTSFHLAIDAAAISLNSDDPKVWDIIDFNGDRKVWHGAPVVSAVDGTLVGVLLIESRTAQVLMLGDEGELK